MLKSVVFRIIGEKKTPITTRSNFGFSINIPYSKSTVSSKLLGSDNYRKINMEKGGILWRTKDDLSNFRTTTQEF